MTDSAADGGWHFENRQRKVKFDEEALRAFLASLAADLARGLSFSVVVGSDAAMQAANGRFRNVRRTTDVLSFPDGEDDYLGDVLISASMAERQAVRLGHSVEAELQTLALHGMLHLRGYDHETDNGEMRAEEDRFRKRYGLPSALIARSAE